MHGFRYIDSLSRPLQKEVTTKRIHIPTNQPADTSCKPSHPDAHSRPLKVSGLDRVAFREKPWAVGRAVRGCVDGTLCWDGDHGAGGKQWVQSFLRLRFFFNNEQ